MDQKMEFPEKWPEVLSHRRKSYKSLNLFKTLNLLFFFKKKVESGLQSRETYLTFFFVKRMYLFATAKAVSIILQCFFLIIITFTEEKKHLQLQGKLVYVFFYYY